MGYVGLLTVKGRKTGKTRRNPVGLFQYNRKRYLFSTFGDVNWVRNLRSAREASVKRGFRSRRVVPVDLSERVRGSVEGGDCSSVSRIRGQDLRFAFSP